MHGGPVVPQVVPFYSCLPPKDTRQAPAVWQRSHPSCTLQSSYSLVATALAPASPYIHLAGLKPPCLDKVRGPNHTQITGLKPSVLTTNKREKGGSEICV